MAAQSSRETFTYISVVDAQYATSSYNATEILGSREAEIRRLEAQIKLSFHKEVSGSRIEPRGWIDQTHTSGAGRRAGSRPRT